LPGGGLDHDEAPGAGLSRELGEELGLDAASVKIGELATSLTFFLDHKEAWLLWLVHRVEIAADAELRLGEGVSEARFIDPVEPSDIYEMMVCEVHDRLRTA
jgi:8-oxo-dGTP pyrophosphatase MutT (NUDIX family)